MQLAVFALAADLTLQMTGMGVVEKSGMGVKASWLEGGSHALVLSMDSASVNWKTTTATPTFMLADRAVWVVKTEIRIGDSTKPLDFKWNTPATECPTAGLGDLGWLPSLSRIFKKNAVQAHVAQTLSLYEGKLVTVEPLFSGLYRWKVIDQDGKEVEGAPYQAYTDSLEYILVGKDSIEVNGGLIYGVSGLDAFLTNLGVPGATDTNDKLVHFDHYRAGLDATDYRYLKIDKFCGGRKRLGKPIFCPPGTIQ